MFGRAVLALVLLAPAALAAPPPGADPALAPWFQSLKRPDNGEGCCDQADCRIVAYRATRDGYEAFIAAGSFQAGTDTWEKVPPGRVLRGDNPTGHGVACWTWFSGFLCFVPGPGT